MSARAGVLDEVRITFLVTIRPCGPDDLEGLEWYGMFTPHREIIQRTFEGQTKGEQLMLVAEFHGRLIGQIWIDLARRRSSGAGVLWAARVIPWLQGVGLGTRLMRAAEEELRTRGYSAAELGVEAHNVRARELYERLGYQVTGTLSEECRYTTPQGEKVCVQIPQTVMSKKLNGGSAQAGAKEMQ